MEPNCRSKRMLAIKRCKHFELGGDKKRKVGVTDVVFLFSACKFSEHYFKGNFQSYSMLSELCGVSGQKKSIQCNPKSLSKSSAANCALLVEVVSL